MADGDKEHTDEKTEIIELPSDLPLETLPPGIRAQLKIIQGAEKGRVIELRAGLNTIGRDERNTIRLRGRSVSARHAVIYFTKSMEWRIRDQGSTNGTLLNGSKVKEFALRSGDKLFIGDQLFLFTGERG
jgi:pSer/pThr/pTyr-binding forkhead associated (FHA) protein